MFHRRQWILDHYIVTTLDKLPDEMDNPLTKLNVKVDVYLMQNVPHVQCLGICEHNEFDAGGSLVVVEFVLTSSKGYEAVSAY